MVKARASDIRANLARLDPKFAAALVYGRDEGMVRERAGALAAQIVGDVSDPFSAIRLDADGVRRDPALVADEMAAMSMIGGRRLVRIDRAADAVADAIGAALEIAASGPRPGANFLLVTAGELGTTSKLRKLFERGKTTLALPCYGDQPEDVEALVHNILSADGLIVEPAALSFLTSTLGGDRLATRGELEKLALYMRGHQPPLVTLADAMACVGDSAGLALGDIAEAVTGGDLKRLDILFERAEARTEAPVGILRAVTRRLLQFDLVCGLMEEGLGCAQAIDRLSPKPFFKDIDGIRAQAPAWRRANVSRALEILSEAEGLCKSTGLPDRAIAMRACMRVASSVAPRRRSA